MNRFSGPPLGIAPGAALDGILTRVSGPANLRAESPYPSCPGCGEKRMAWVGSICAHCHNQRGASRFGSAPAAARPAPAAAPTSKRNAAAAELIAWNRGMELRAQYPGVAVGTIAAALGITVEYVPGTELKGSTDARMVVGRSMPAANHVWLARDRDFAEREYTLGHEVGHCLRLDDDLEPWDMERVCDTFAFGLTGTRSPR